jgi:hypothetical protein
MNCEELRDHYERYALGVAAQPERGEIRAHLDRGCEVCTSGVNRAIANVTPPRRSSASDGSGQKRFGWAPFWAAAAVLLLAATVYFGGRERQFAEDLAQSQLRLRAQTSELAHLKQAFAMLNAPDTVAVSFSARQPITGNLFVNRDGVLLIAGNLPAPPAGMAFEMWVIPNVGKPAPAGMFRPETDGEAVHVSRQRCAPGDTVAVTLENEAGVDQPTSTPIVAVPIPAASR